MEGAAAVGEFGQANPNRGGHWLLYLVAGKGAASSDPKFHSPPIDLELRHRLNVAVLVQLAVQNRVAAVPCPPCRPCRTDFDRLNGLPV